MEELDESELGTQEFWNTRYTDETTNFRNHGDVGEIWFGEDIVDRIMKWMNNNPAIDKSHSILDVGCGNGMLLIELFNEGYTNLRGIDYSKEGIVLATEIAKKENCNINYEVVDLLSDDITISAVDIVHDKGTFDAISLTADAAVNKRKYIDNIHKFLKHNGLLIITSCNWTNEELIQQFECKFEYFDYIPTPQFKFGGKTGSVVSSVIFKKK